MKQPKNIWRIHLEPHEVKKNEFDFCKENDIIGIGWHVCKKPGNTTEYLEWVKLKYSGSKRRGWNISPRAIACRMKVDDLVWTKNRATEKFYIGQVEGKWKYCDSECHVKHDIVSIRRCKLFYVGDANYVGPDVTQSFSGATLRLMSKNVEREYSIAEFKKAERKDQRS